MPTGSPRPADSAGRGVVPGRTRTAREIPSTVSVTAPQVRSAACVTIGLRSVNQSALQRLYASLPSACFHAAMPPWMWHAVASPTSCAACTAIAERSPNAQ